MPLTFVSGDPLLTRAHTLGVGHNSRGRTELGAFETALRQQHPASFSGYSRRCRAQRQQPGRIWLWSQSVPQILFLTIRDSSVGATRLRYVQSALITIAREYLYYNIRSLALAPLGTIYERAEIMPLIRTWLGSSKLPVVVYTDYQPGVRAPEPFDQSF